MNKLKESPYFARTDFKSNLAFVWLLDQYICNMSERVFTAKDYTGSPSPFLPCDLL